ncbi:MAG: TerB family tellurite resistance protein [Pseudomonadota bacterium]
MSIDAELEDFFATEIDAVVANPDQFRRKLGIGREAFRLLSAVENTGSYVSAISSGAGAAGVSYAAWLSSLGVFGQVGLALGVVATPVGMVGAAGAVGAGTFLLTHRLLKRLRRETVEEVPKFINSPLDLLGISISEILAPTLCKIVLADDDVTETEVARVRSYLIDEWGYDETFVAPLLQFDARHSDEWSWDQLGGAIKSVDATGDIKALDFSRELMRIAEEVAGSDGVVCKSELAQLGLLREALGLKKERGLRVKSRAVMAKMGLRLRA